MLWPQRQWICEVLVELAEAEWMHVPRCLHDSLMQWAVGWGNTHVFERIFHVLKDKQRRVDIVGKLGRAASWVALYNPRYFTSLAAPARNPRRSTARQQQGKQ